MVFWVARVGPGRRGEKSAHPGRVRTQALADARTRVQRHWALRKKTLASRESARGLSNLHGQLAAPTTLRQIVRGSLSTQGMETTLVSEAYSANESFAWQAWALSN